jgi:hypothetical protein
MTAQEAAEYSGYDIQHARLLARQSKIGAVRKALGLSTIDSRNIEFERRTGCRSVEG